MQRSTTRTTRTALALAALAVVIPTAASARPYPEPAVSGAPQAKPIATRDFSMSSQASSQATSAVVRPDDRAGVRGASQNGWAQLDPAYVRALRLRGQALNAKYGPRQFDPAYIRAMRLRGEALNEQYGGGTQTAVRPDDRGGLRTIGTVSATQSSGGFDVGDATIGAIGAFGLSLLVAGGMLLALHVIHQRRDRVATL